MFGKKQEFTKEMEEKLNTAQLQLENLQSQMKKIENNRQRILHCFESQIIAQSAMDKGLEKVQDNIRDTVDLSSESGQAYEQFAIEFVDMREQMEEDEQKKRELQEAVHKQKKRIEEAVEENKQFAAPVELLHEVRSDLAGGLQEICSQLHQMQDFSKQMSVLSLNCAIEAGRLGESGRQFVGAAEDVRRLSSEYEHAAKAAEEKLSGMEEKLSRLEEQEGGLAAALKSRSTAASQLLKGINETADICGQTAERIFSEKVLAFTGIIKKISQNYIKITSLQRRALSQMGTIGESLEEEQEARKEMEDIIDELEKILQS